MAIIKKVITGLLARLNPNQIKDVILLQRQIEHQLNLEEYTKKELVKIQNALEISKKQIVKKIKKLPEQSFTKRTLQKQLNEILILTEGVSGTLNNNISKISYEAFKVSLLAHNDILSFGNRVTGFKTLKASANTLKSIIKEVPVGGYLLQDWVGATFNSELKEKIQQDFLIGSFKGENVDALARRVAQGFSNISTREAVTLARTYVQSVNNTAMQMVYDNNTDIVKGVRWSAVLESGNTKTGRGTCPRCSVLDGTIYKMKEKHPSIPLHPRCRCLLLPETISYKELGLDIEEIEKVYRPTKIAGLLNKTGQDKIGFLQGDYETFYKQQSKAFQINALGPSRANLVADKKVNFKDLVDLKTGRLRTLHDLIPFIKN